jgi:hypothetical protein
LDGGGNPPNTSNSGTTNGHADKPITSAPKPIRIPNGIARMKISGSIYVRDLEPCFIISHWIFRVLSDFFENNIFQKD